jgi:exodeoxyribonuclease V beta subunit
LPEPENARQSTAAEEPTPAPEDAIPAPEGEGLHAFPRGPGPGTFLHGLLEWAGREGFARAAANAPLCAEVLERRCRLRGWQAHTPALQSWLARLLEEPLPLGDTPLRLAALTQYQVELEFWLESRRVDTQSLDALVTAGTLQGVARPRLLDDTLNGMLKGFMDLVFEWQGRYYVADWKSNWLGPDASAYTAEAMQRAVLESRYELQYTLYLLALHRLLKNRLPDYDYDHHIGGAMYVFLRGKDNPTRGVHTERPPRALIEQLDALFAGRRAQA